MSKPTEKPKQESPVLKTYSFAYYPEFSCEAESQEEANKIFTKYVENLNSK